MSIKDRRLLLTPKEVCELLQVSAHKLYSMRRSRKGPEFLRLGHKTVRYPKAAVVAWLLSQQEVAQ